MTTSPTLLIVVFNANQGLNKCGKVKEIMRYLVLGDIHSNLSAFNAVLKEAKEFEQILNLGDVVGYAPYPNECIDTLKHYKQISILGNHDGGVIGKVPLTLFNPQAAIANRLNAQVLTSENKSFLENLPLELTIEEKITLVHGSPKNPIWEYLLSCNEALGNLSFFKTPICFVAHTHIPVVFEFKEGRCLEIKAKAELHLNSNSSHIINPGSVGQPRDGNPKASFLIFDSQNLKIEFKRVEYDIFKVQEELRKEGYPWGLAKRLTLGI